MKRASTWYADAAYTPKIYTRDAMEGGRGETLAVHDPTMRRTQVRTAFGEPWVAVADQAAADAILREAGWVLS